ncbi:PAS-domain containing protein [Yoonia algicola]|uniref:histidine kinase n=1 Tax=Yoonia algicola TaxID=3137368 RepID=A0AAN0M9B9_9RHOB
MGVTDISRHDMILSGLNLIKQAISLHDEELRLVVANRRFQQMFSLPDALVAPGAEFRDIVMYLTEKGEYGQVDDVAGFVDEKVRLAFTFEPHYFERTRSNGTAISVEGSPFQQGGWISVYTDITETKRQEDFFRSHTETLSEKLLQRSEDLALANRALSATVNALEVAKQEVTDSREHLALMNTMTPGHIAHVNAAGVYTHSNGNLPTILPVGERKIVGQSFENVLGPFVWAQVAPQFARALQGNPTASEIRDEASGRFMRLAMTPDMAGDGRVQGAYILTVDVTEEVSARAALAHARRKELATQLTSGMAHDFANLLTIILGQQAKLDELASLHPALAEVSATINSAAKRGGELIENLSRIEAHRSLNPVSVKVADFLTNVRQLARAAVPDDTDLTISCDIPDEALTFDPGFAQDAILNLVLNAAEAQNGPAIITARLHHATDGMLEITVADNGPGFSEDALANALAPFYSTKSGKIGRGLGLTTAFDFAKSSGGTLRLRNHAAGGAIVTLRIPYTPARTVEAGLVLLVDDTLDVRQTMRNFLRRSGHAVVEAASVEEAQKLLSLEGLTHVVTDLAIGEGSGLDVAANVPSGVPVLIVTGLPPSDALHQKAKAAHPVLPKPFDFATFEAAFLRAST